MGLARRTTCLFVFALLFAGPDALSADETSRSGLQYVLTKASGPGRHPLMIALHGTGGNTGWVGDGWAGQLGKHGCYVACPRSTGQGRVPGTDKPASDGLQRWDDVDIDKVLDLVRELIEKHPIDPRRVYIMGYSNGAFYAAKIGLTHPEVFAGAVICAGGLAATPHPDAKGMGIWQFHGDADTSTPVSYGRSLRDACEKAAFTNYHYKEFPGAGHIVFGSEAPAVVPELLKCRTAFIPGADRSFDWKGHNAGLALLVKHNKAAIYFWSPDDKGSAEAERLETECFPEPAFRKGLEKIVFVKVNRKEQPDLAAKYGVDGPAIVVVDRLGTVHAKETGDFKPAALASALKKAARAMVLESK